MITKYLLPIVAALSMAGGMFLQAKVFNPKCPDIKFPEYKCPDCRCPESSSIDFDKVKNFRGTLVLNNNIRVDVNGDSLVISRIREALKAELEYFKVKKCR